MQWFAGNVSTAIQVSRKNRALLIVYISTDNDEGRLFDDFWNQVDSKNLLCPAVGIKLMAGETAARQFAEIYPSPIVPAAYLIDLDGKPLEVITFLVGKTYDQFRSRFDRGTAAFISKFGVFSGNSGAPTSSEPLRGAGNGGDAENSKISASETPKIAESAENPSSTPSEAPTSSETQKTVENSENPISTSSGGSTSSESSKNAETLKSTAPEAPTSSESIKIAENAENSKIDPSLAEKVAHARKLLEQKKQKDAEKKKESEKFTQSEIRKASEAKQERDNKALIEAAKERKKEKLEAQKEKERILAQIKADREDKMRKFETKKAVEEGERQEKMEKRREEKRQLEAVKSERCRLQIRLPDGSTFVEEFPSNDVLRSLVAIIQQKPTVTTSFEIHQQYPRRIFKEDDYDKTFLDNQLTPSTSLIVVLKPSQAENMSKAVVSSGGSLIQLLISPIWLIWGWFCNILGTGSANAQNKKNEPKNDGNSGNGGERRGGRGLPRDAQVRRRGNVAGLDNPNDDDPDERASFNGNSTQFL